MRIRFAALALCLGTVTGLSSAQPALTSGPAAARFVYDDVQRFVGALERIHSGADARKTIEADYFSAATPGLKALIARKGISALALAQAVEKQPDAYRSLSTLVARLVAHEPAMRESFARLKDLLPGAVLPPVYFIVSDPSFGGGLADPAGLLIAFGPQGFEDVLDRIPHLVAHESVHVQQALLQGVEQYRSIYGPSGSLLAIAIREGTADLIAQLTSGDHINPRARAYGLPHERELWKQFQREMHGTATGEWFFVTPANKAWPQDLGYFIGYRIAESYYRRAADKRQALRDMLTVTDYRAFLKSSVYDP